MAAAKNLLVLRFKAPAEATTPISALFVCFEILPTKATEPVMPRIKTLSVVKVPLGATDAFRAFIACFTNAPEEPVTPDKTLFVRFARDPVGPVNPDNVLLLCFVNNPLGPTDPVKTLRYSFRVVMAPLKAIKPVSALLVCLIKAPEEPAAPERTLGSSFAKVPAKVNPAARLLKILRDTTPEEPAAPLSVL
jgi:hypothetical protein